MMVSAVCSVNIVIHCCILIVPVSATLLYFDTKQFSRPHNREEAAKEEAKKMVAAGLGPMRTKGGGAVGGVGLARAAGVAGLDVEDAADDERYLRQVNVSCLCFLIPLPVRIYEVVCLQIEVVQ